MKEILLIVKGADFEMLSLAMPLLMLADSFTEAFDNYEMRHTKRRMMTAVLKKKKIQSRE